MTYPAADYCSERTYYWLGTVIGAALTIGSYYLYRLVHLLFNSDIYATREREVRRGS